MTDTLDDYLTPLLPVSEWSWALYKITWWNNVKTERKIMWLVESGVDGVYDRVNDRWPSTYWASFDYERIQDCKEPPRLSSRHGVLHVDCWEHGTKLAREMGLTG